MLVNADFMRRALVHAADAEWVSSPIAGIERRLLDRVGDEVARATSLVRYAPRMRFLPHVHGGGEEFLVLEGVFQDEHGSFPAGSYVRNPPGSKHAPWSDEGCVIFVKLWQFEPADRTHVWVRSDKTAPSDVPELMGVTSVPLFRDKREEVRLEVWEPFVHLQQRQHPGGIELFVLEGSFEESAMAYRKYSWLRLPPGDAFQPRVGPRGARVWVKMGHLAEPQMGPEQRRAR